MATKKNRAILAILAIGGVLILAAGLMFNSDTIARAQQLTGNENHVVTLSQAVGFIQNFKANPTVPATKGGFFGRSIFDKILAQDRCIGIWYYYAKKDDGTATLVIVGVDSNGNDMEKGTIGELTYPCPPLCPVAGELSR